MQCMASHPRGLACPDVVGPQLLPVDDVDLEQSVNPGNVVGDILARRVPAFINNHWILAEGIAITYYAEPEGVKEWVTLFRWGGALSPTSMGPSQSAGPARHATESQILESTPVLVTVRDSQGRRFAFWRCPGFTSAESG